MADKKQPKCTLVTLIGVTQYSIFNYHFPFFLTLSFKVISSAANIEKALCQKKHVNSLTSLSCLQYESETLT